MAFKPNRALLNVNFDGYKLSKDSLSYVSQQFGSAVKVARLKAEQFSYQHVRAFSTHNHLAKNSWESNSVYWFGEDFMIQKATYGVSEGLSIQPVYSFNPLKAENSVNASIIFLNKVLCLFCDGHGRLQLLYTGSEAWKSVVESISLTGLEGQPYMILAARLSEDGHLLHVATIELKDPAALKRTTTDMQPVVVIYRWHTIRFSVDLHPDEVNPSQSSDGTAPSKIESVNLLAAFHSLSIPLYCAFTFTPVAANLLIINEANIHPVQRQSEEVAVKDEAVAATHIEMESEQKDSLAGHQGLGYLQEKAAYEWTQNDTDVVITVRLPGDVTKLDIVCTIERLELVVGLTDGTTYIRGELHASIEPDTSTWTIEKNVLEVILEKQETNLQWPHLLAMEGARNQLPPDMSQIEGLTHLSREENLDLTSEVSGLPNSNGKEPSPKRPHPIMQNPLEECDTTEEDATLFVFSEGDTIEQRAGLGGRQIIFTAPAMAADPPLFCLRHDVDAVVWQPKPVTITEAAWDHVGTFNALGYVQASKRDRKFTTCSANLDFAAISDCNRHVFVYMQPPGGLMSNSAVQYVHTLSTAPHCCEILGLQACSSGLFVLREKELLFLLVPVNTV